jgi:hypothetical protein
MVLDIGQERCQYRSASPTILYDPPERWPVCAASTMHCQMVTLVVLAAMPTVAQSIFVSNDEWVFSHRDLNLPGTDDTQFAKNVALWLTSGWRAGGKTGQQILILSSDKGLQNADLIALLESPPVSDVVTVTAKVPTSFSTNVYQAIYVSGDCEFSPLTFSTPCSDANFTTLGNALAAYVNSGGNVFLEAGITCNDGSAWNGFLNQFGLSIANSCNDILNSIVNVSAFQMQLPYGPGLFTGVNNVYIDNGENVLPFGTECGVQIFNDTLGNGLYGAWQPCSCGQTGPHRDANGSIKPTAISPPAQHLRTDTLLPSGLDLYDNGFANGTLDAYTINSGYSVSNSFELAYSKHGDSITGISFQQAGNSCEASVHGQWRISKSKDAFPQSPVQLAPLSSFLALCGAILQNLSFVSQGASPSETY